MDMRASSEGTEPAPDQILTAEEGIRLKQRTARPTANEQRPDEEQALRDVRPWHWMGLYGNPTAVTTVANQEPRCLAGEVVTTAYLDTRADGTKVLVYSTWMAYP
ncbi:hypothetical protein ACFWAR_14390 [Streptomyces sp. NPDC059917]|uniref:hypothetical protein n=1 Tax=Streptomyces sp. NPDC059917 TaxID=3347002 RepID=UPI00364C5BC4